MKRIFISALMVLGAFTFAFGQDAGNERSADRTLRGSGRVNASTLGMEFQLPLGAYPGRGINVPINLSYSSKVWRLNYNGHANAPGASWSDCYAHYAAAYGERSASGWTTSMEAPYIEYVGVSDHYDNDGLPYRDFSVGCPTSQMPNQHDPIYYVRRILVHLPGGETHEVRPDDTIIESPSSGATGTSPFNAANWNATYYAADGSNIKYIQNSGSNTYRIQMPDGSFYDLDPTTGHGGIRKAQKFTDRNGNFTNYYGPGSVDSNGVTHPNGYWKDTLGRNISIPLGGGPGAPTTAGSPQIYSMPGMTGSYKLHWKQLNGGTQAESAMTDISSPNYQLKYPGETYGCNNPFPTYCTRAAQDTLFRASGTAFMLAAFLFNPVVLTEIELPTGQKYKFTYDNYGRIEQIHYPTGGREHFTYSVVPTLSTLEPDSSAAQTNFGVTNRKVYESAGDQTPYEWSYSATYVAPQGYKISINNPDGTKNERFLHRGNDACVGGCLIGTFGYDNGLAGMAYEELSFDSISSSNLVSRKLTHWEKKSFSGGGSATADWHPRVTYEKTIAFDPNGTSDAVSATVKYEYEGDLNLRERPVLVNKTTQYAFEALTGGSSLTGFQCEPTTPSGWICVPSPQPTPVSTPEPPQPTSPPVKIVETTYVINDTTTYPDWVRDIFKAKNMVGLVRSVTVKDGGGTVVSRSETKYDEGYFSPEVGRGNPTLSRVWDSTKGAWDNSSGYIETRARFDTYGNQTETWDAKGNVTTTTFDGTHNAFPVQVTSPIPSDGTHGSNTAFVTAATFNPVTGLPLTTTDANNLRTEIEYDAATLRPRFTRTFSGSTQVGSTSETIYNDATNNYWVKNRSQIDENRWAESITYFDGLGRAWKSEQVDSGGNIFTEKEFDADGRVSRVTNPFRANETRVWTTNVYDEASRVKEVVLPDGAKVKTDYGVSVNAPIGVTKQITDQAGKKRKGITNVLGQMIRVIEDPTGQNLNTDYVFDTLGNLRKTIQDEQSRYFYHDSLGRLLRAKQPEQNVNGALALPIADPITGHNQWSAAYSYDDNGNILTTTDAKNKTVSATYDNLNRLKVRDYSDLSMPDVEFYYDGKYRDITDTLQTASGSVKGKTTGIKSSVSRTNFTEFDELGRLESHQQITDGQTYSTGYIYNLSGVLIQETYPSGRVVKNTLGIDGELLQVQSKKNANYGFHTYAGSFSYDSAGAVTKMQLGNGRWETASFNNRLQITQIGLGTTDTTQNLLKLEYNYSTPSTTNNNGSMREQKITVPTVGQATGFTATQTYLYDDLNRLQSAEEKVSGSTTWKQTFTIDRYGNRRFDAANTTTLGSCTEAVCNPTISTSNNRISSSGYSFDANGNVTQDAEGKQFIYDAENHQTEVKDNLNNVIGEYRYDGEGRRVKKISASETTIFVYNASGQLVAEYSTELAVTPQVSYLTQDHLGSPRIISNENGTVTSRTDFTAFGEENYTPQRTDSLGYTGQNDIRKGYTGYEKDDESGLDFAQARYYNSGLGRYTSVDPLTASASIKNPQTFNRYSYVLNSPYKFTDPLGLIPESTGACGSRCPNSGPTVDGSAFRGRDATWDWAREYYGSVEGYSLGQPDGSTVVENLASNFAYIFAPRSAPVAVGASTSVQQGTVVLAYGEPGAGEHDLGSNLKRAAETRQAELRKRGINALIVGVSSITDFQNGPLLLAAMRELLVYGIELFAHGANDRIYIGDQTSDINKITMENVSTLKNNSDYLTYIRLHSCFTGKTDNGIASALAKQLNVKVYAPTAGTIFSSNPDRVTSRGLHPNTGPTYLIPDGGSWEEFP